MRIPLIYIGTTRTGHLPSQVLNVRLCNSSAKMPNKGIMGGMAGMKHADKGSQTRPCERSKVDNHQRCQTARRLTCHHRTMPQKIAKQACGIISQSCLNYHLPT